MQHGARSFSAMTRNISLGGLFVETEETLPFGARVSLSFTIPTQAEAVKAEGRVRWIENAVKNMRGIGIRFDGLRAKDVWIITTYLEQRADEPAGQG